MSSSGKNQSGKYPLVHNNFILSRGVLYSLLSILIVLGYALLVSGLGMLMASLIEPGNPIIIGIAIFLLALIVNPLKQSLEKVLDLVFFRGEHVYQECLQTFSGDLTNVVGLVELIQVLRQYVAETLNPLSFHIFLFEPLIDQYIATPDENDDITSDIRFSANTPLVDMLNEKRSPILVTGTSHQKQKLQSDQARVELLGAEVLIPLPGRDQLAGWLVLGSHQMGESYSSRELGFLGALGDQAALAVERAQIISNMEDRVREMNMLTRVAQGINITLEHDDM
jgi:hypothetical protein